MATPPSQEPKRKRGKRKVLKKTTKRDEKGYLGLCPYSGEENADGIVTKNEYVYESYSEDEDEEAAEEKASKKSVPAPSKTEGEKKKGKAAGAAGQKSLMSFFGKK
jgi:DNA polymerase delta subunit 3